MDFIKLNFGSIDWEMEGFKRKVMVSKPPEPSLLPFSRSTSVAMHPPPAFETIATLTQQPKEQLRVWQGISLEQYYNDYLQGGSKNTTLTKTISQETLKETLEHELGTLRKAVPVRDESTPTFSNHMLLGVTSLNYK